MSKYKKNANKMNTDFEQEPIRFYSMERYLEMENLENG